MKKNLLFVTVTFFALNASAQFSTGIKAGINIAKEKYSNSTYSTSGHVFFTGGIFTNYSLSKNFALELSALYSGEGSNESYMSGQTKVTGVVKINRINIPLMIQYKTPIGLYFETGPQIGFLLSAKGKYSNSSTTYDFKSGTQSTLMSWCIGAGYRFSKILPGLGINASYNAGLSKVNKGSVNANKITSSVFSIKLQYALFGGSKKEK